MKKALKKFEQVYEVKSHKCGLFFSSDYPFLGASPDAVVSHDCLVEIKCPFAGRNEEIKPGKHFKFLKYDSNKNIVLETSSNYFDQIQGQMYLSKRQYC